MKKSDALKILGLSEGANEDAIKKAHRKKIIANHPDRFAGDPKREASAEEATKQINEARDVLLNRSWKPEYAGAPYATQNASSAYTYWREAAAAARAGADSDDPFTQGYRRGRAGSAGGASGAGGNTYVWTSWDGFYGPDSPFSAPKATPKEIYERLKKAYLSDLIVLLGKIIVSILAGVIFSPAGGLLCYSGISVIYGLWKRFGSCLIFVLIPIFIAVVVIMAPIILLIPPIATFILGFFFATSVIFDIRNLGVGARKVSQAKTAL